MCVYMNRLLLKSVGTVTSSGDPNQTDKIDQWRVLSRFNPCIEIDFGNTEYRNTVMSKCRMSRI